MQSYLNGGMCDNLFFEADTGLGGGIDANGAANINDEPDEAKEDKETYTKEELLQLLQSETDKRVQQALKTQQKKYEKELNKQKSLAGLDEEARAKAAAQQRITDLEEELGKYRLMATKAEITKVLSNRGLDPNLVDFVVTTDDTEECMQKIETLEGIFKKMVKSEVNQRLKSPVPKAAVNQKENVLTQEAFRKMSLAEQQQLYRANEELYHELTQR